MNAWRLFDGGPRKERCPLAGHMELLCSRKTGHSDWDYQHTDEAMGQNSHKQLNVEGKEQRILERNSVEVK